MMPNTAVPDCLQGRFLLVDDDGEHLLMLERIVTSMGLTVVATQVSQQAIALLDAEPFDVVISDIRMPGLDGMGLLRAIKKGYAATDVILMTGFSQTYTFSDVIREGATDYLEKPFTKDIVRAKVLRILAERRLRAEYQQELVQRRQTETVLQQNAEKLDKRRREVDCLYQVSRILEQDQGGLDQILAQTMRAIPSALRYPEGAIVRLSYGGQVCQTADFQPSPQSLRFAIRANGVEVGALEVAYALAMEGVGEGGFLDEERALVAEIAVKLGRLIDRKRDQEELRNYSINLEEAVRSRSLELQLAQQAIESVFQHIPDGILSVGGDLVVTHVNDKCLRYLEAIPGRRLLSSRDKFQGECCAVLLNTLHNQEAINDYRLEINGAEGASQVVLLSTSLLTDSQQGRPGALLVIHDITRLVDLEKQLQERRRFRQMVGNCPQMREIYAKVRKLASVETAILITGDSGTGKEILVETLHNSGNRAAKPLVTVNCAALPENLLESELFGHIRGAFTGAVKDREGRIAAAQGGILFLDEIGEISPLIQLKLLRFLEGKEYERVGESQARRADVRVVAATNADLAKKVQAGLFRQDLYYRLKVMVIHLPPLRERQDDIPLLIEHFLSSFNRRFNKSIVGVSPEALALLMGYDWPGNIRELKHAIEHAVILCSDRELTPEHLPKDLLATPHDLPPASLAGQPARGLGRADLLSALRQTDGNKAKTARLLKLSRTTLYSKIKEFDL